MKWINNSYFQSVPRAPSLTARLQKLAFSTSALLSYKHQVFIYLKKVSWNGIEFILNIDHGKLQCKIINDWVVSDSQDQFHLLLFLPNA